MAQTSTNNPRLPALAALSYLFSAEKSTSEKSNGSTTISLQGYVIPYSSKKHSRTYYLVLFPWREQLYTDSQFGALPSMFGTVYKESR